MGLVIGGYCLRGRCEDWVPADTGAFDSDGDISLWEILAFALLKAVEVGFGLFDP